MPIPLLGKQCSRDPSHNHSTSVSLLPLTKGPNQLCPHSCSEGFHQTESGEACKGCIVEEHNVEIAQPVEASKITQKVKASES